MKKYTLLAAALLATGVAYAQGPTNQYSGTPLRALSTPTNANSTNPVVNGASAFVPQPSYTAYSQDSYINQAGSLNYATVTQVDGRTGGTNGGNSAVLNQTGNQNTATQIQTLSNSPFQNATYGPTGGTATARQFMKSTQDGSNSQTNQTQEGGVFNTMTVTQGAGTSGNRAIQNQRKDGSGSGDAQQAVINQTNASGFSAASGNRAEQNQTGILNTAQIDQQGSNGWAKQTQTSSANILPNNSAYIGQGAPGSRNTAEQIQTGSANAASIEQSRFAGNAGNNNFALQTQSQNLNQADIKQRSSNNYAEQVQSGLAGGGGNYSSMNQSMVSSAAYSIQSGNNNTAIVVQR